MAFFVLLIIILVILIVWWALVQNARKYRPDFPLHTDGTHSDAMDGSHLSDEASVSMAAPEMSETAMPEMATRVAGSAVEADDLTILEGVGPKINELLHEAGIMTFAQLAATDVTRLREILEAANLRFIDPGTWSEQARLAAEGRSDELTALMGRLRGGREVSS